MESTTYKACPCCGAAAISKQLVAEDFTVTHRQFEIWQCNNCSLRFTQNIPGQVWIGEYYRSDAYVSHTDTKKGIVNQLYHFIRKRTLRKKLALLQHVTGLRSGVLADIGSGTGAFANAMQEAAWQVTALEPDATTRQKAMELYRLHAKPVEDLHELPAAAFDAVTMWHVLEHVHELHPYIAQIKKILKPGGKALIAVPNYTSYDAKVYGQYWAAYDVPRHLYHFCPAAMQQLLQQHQLEIIDIKPMWFDSYYIAMLSEQYKTGHNNLVKATWTGLVSNCKALFNKQACSSVIYVVSNKL